MTAQLQESELLKRSLKAIQVLQDEVNKQKEQIAVVGLGCRFPQGANSPDEFWNLLIEKKDGIQEIPAERWDADRYYDPDENVGNKMYTRRAGFLDGNVGTFDNRFFEISPREAIEMDPQQRMLLEVSWEALERAGVMNDKLSGTKAGVYIGMISSEYAAIPRTPSEMDPYAITGSSPNIASGRLAHYLGLKGPALTIDTACSSSLVAVHIACESLRKGETDLALAGGVNTLLNPKTFILLCNMQALSPDGKCRTFDANANGYVRAEGCGLVVLKRLSDAKRDNNSVLAVIHGSAMNHDGSTSGLTVPNGLAQGELIQEALKNANLTPDQITYIETHGTGTPLGDPIEVQALTKVFRRKEQNREELVLGAVKSNIGHLEASAGVAGLIKAVLCIQNKTIAPNLHFETINPKINLQAIPATVPVEPKPWNPVNKPRIAGISSFGFSGTNAHVIVGEPEEQREESTEAPEYNRLLCMSARNETSLDRMVVDYREYFKNNPNLNKTDLCYTANALRTHFGCRRVFLMKKGEDLTQSLRNQPIVNIINKEERETRLVALFLNELKGIPEAIPFFFNSFTAFREAFEECAKLFSAYTDFSLIYFSSYQNGQVDGGIGKIILFSFQYAMLELWKSLAVIPTAVIGLGVGEVTAAIAAGVMTLETGASIVAWYGKLTNNFTVQQGDLNRAKLRFISGRPNSLENNKALLSPQYWQEEQGLTEFLNTGIEFLRKQKYEFFLEITSNHRLFQSENQQSIQNEASDGLEFYHTVAQLYGEGINLNWERWQDEQETKLSIALPTYPFDRKFYWLGKEKADEVLYTGENDYEPDIDPLDGCLIDSPLAERQFEYKLSSEIFPELEHNRNVLHVGYYQEMIGRVAKETNHQIASYHLRDMEFKLVLYFDGIQERNLQVLLGAKDEEGEQEFRFFSKEIRKTSWSLHTQGKLSSKTLGTAPEVSVTQRQEIRERCTNHISGAEFHENVEQRGFGSLGPSVKWVEELWEGDGEVLVKFRQPNEEEKQYDNYGLGFHPGVVDTIAQLYMIAGKKCLEEKDLFMVVKVAEFNHYQQKEAEELWLHLTVEDQVTEEGNMKGCYTLFNQDGTVLIETKGKELTVINSERREEMGRIFGGGITSQDGEYSDVFGVLLSTPFPEQQKGILSDYLRQLISNILKMPVEEISDDAVLMELGIDSLVGVELKNTIDHDLNMDFPLQYIYETPTITKLAENLVDFLPGSSSDKVESWFTEEPKKDAESWIAYRKKQPNAKLRLYCIPYGVRGASLYRDWQDKFPDTIEVCPIQLPGKENRLRERPFGDLSKLVIAMAEALEPEFNEMPFAFYGHSGGGFFAYRLAYHLWQRGNKNLTHFLVGGFTSPSIWPNPVVAFTRSAFKRSGFDSFPRKEELEQIDDQTREEIWDFFGMLFDTVTMPDEAKQAVEPATIDEFDLLDKYEYDMSEPTFDVPITAFHGNMDRVVSEIEMLSWKSQTTGPFRFEVLEGSHFFIHEDEAEEPLLKVINEQLSPYLK